jgi:hypothetical protein
MPDFALELAAVHELASLTGFNITNVRRGPDERGIDVLFEIDGRRVGAQHTTFHWDEGDSPGVRGSPARAKEEIARKATTTAFGMFAKGDYRPALWLRVDDKIGKAALHDNRDLICETWLVISASVGRAAASTLIAPEILRADNLNALCHAHLVASQFECACLVLHMQRVIWGWDRPGGWRVLADPDAAGRQEHKERMSAVLDQIRADFRARTKRSTRPLPISNQR